ncbi:hypothetical protein QJS83_10175 [Bdellovibrio sp. 22V]|uniref:HD domain-containing protein n=1 Tax=Bdellovibrio sp. 22V TaxID=3044166 RepID=UPI002543B42B|nr:HD domain-containing phosphohydrolase [Bdellovibrio sp. 22V]WII70826.1 hypothetical protein QJS83_10175 [Bdellovibrio sp. 22V]
MILSESDEVLSRAKHVISTHFFTFRQLNYQSLPQEALGDLLKAQLILLAQETDEPLVAFATRVDRVLDLFPRSRLVTVMSAASAKENLEGTQNVRVTPLSQSEFHSSLKFEYLCLYRCRFQFFEIQNSDFFPMTTMMLPAFVRLELNQRYLAVLFSNTVLSDEKFSRIEKASGLYIQIKDSEKYLQYINSYYDTSGKALRKRARALFLCVIYYSLRLNEILLFDFKTSKDDEVSAAYEGLKKVAEELFQIMRGEENLWDTFREAVSDEFTIFWRSPWIATYAALMSLKSGQGDPMTAFLAGLFADVGIYDLEEKIAHQYFLSDDKKIPEDSRSSFEKHPLLSLNRCLIKKLPLDEAVKSALVCTHERADEKGFPNQVPAAQLPVEAQLVQFAERIDQEVLTTMQKNGVGFRFLKEKLWEAESKNPGAFSSEFLSAIAESLI